MVKHQRKLGTRLRWPVLCVVLLLGGCSKPDTPRGADQVDADAPGEWEVYLDWAEGQINQAPPPVPLPADPRLSESKWPIVRLDELLAGAGVTCVWQPTASGSTTLAMLGPFRSDSPRPDFRVRHYEHRTFGKSVTMTITGFQTRREDVGSISTEIRVPFGRHIDLIWSRNGRIRVPLPDNQSFWTLNVAADGLVDWSGPLDLIQVRTDGFGAGVVEIRSLRFLPREETFPKPVGVRRVNLGREIRNAVYAHCPATVRFAGVKLPQRAKLQVGLGHVMPTQGSRAGTTVESTPGEQAFASTTVFEIVIEHDDQQLPILKRRLEPGERWTDVSVDLAAWGGKTVAVILKTTSSTPASVALWANPLIYEPVDDPPSMVLYLIDTLAAKHVDLYGYDRATTPNIAALAAEGVWFGRAFCNSPVTAASVPDIQLSLPTERHGVYAPSMTAPRELVPLADALRAAGFATALFSTNVYASPCQNTDQGFDHFIERLGFAWKGISDRTVPLDDVRHWLEVHRDRPTFVYIHTAEPHAPYAPPAGFAGRFDPDYRGSVNGTFGRNGFHTARNERDIAHVAALYDEEILYADTRFGMFLGLLDELRLRERANVFLIADHGEELQEHGHWGHGPSLHTEVLHTPWIAAGPLVTARGRVDVPVQLYDVMPTILALFGLPEPYELAGQSLLPFLQDQARADKDAFDQRIIFHSHHCYAGLGIVQYAVIEAARWKLMYTYDEEPVSPGGKHTSFALYDLQDFFYDKEDVIAEHRDVARRLIGELIVYRRQQHPYDPRLKGAELKLDPEQIRQLQALGYVGRDEDNDEDEDD